MKRENRMCPFLVRAITYQDLIDKWVWKISMGEASEEDKRFIGIWSRQRDYMLWFHNYEGSTK